jgi:hypothetical protein
MATNFPTSLDALTNPVAGDSLNSPSHAGQHADANDAIEALQAKVGVNGSAVTTSIDYKLRNLDGSAITNGTITGAIVDRLEENWNIIVTSAVGTINLNVLTASIWYYQGNAASNLTINVRGDGSTTLNSLLAVGDSITVVFANTNGAQAYYPNVFQIDGSTVTPKWQGGAAYTGSSLSIDVYVYTIVKTAATPTYTVFASGTKFA